MQGVLTSSLVPGTTDHLYHNIAQQVPAHLDSLTAPSCVPEQTYAATGTACCQPQLASTPVWHLLCCPAAAAPRAQECSTFTCSGFVLSWRGTSKLGRHLNRRRGWGVHWTSALFLEAGLSLQGQCSPPSPRCCSTELA